MSFSRILLAACVTTLIAGSPGSVFATSFVLQRIVDTSTPVPGGSGTFSVLYAPAMSGPNVVFRAVDQSDDVGVYVASSSGLTVVADKSTPIPGYAEYFGSALLNAAPAIDGFEVAFVGGPDGALPYPTGAGVRYGVYRWSAGGIDVVADLSTAIPDNDGLFLDFKVPTPSMDAGKVVFSGSGGSGPGGLTFSGGEGLYSWEDEILSSVIDALRQRAIVGERILFDFGQPVVRGDTMVFLGDSARLEQNELGEYQLFDRQTSLFKATPGEVVSLLDNVEINGLSYHDGTVAFLGRIGDTLEPAAIFAIDASGLRTVYEESPSRPWVTKDGIYFAASDSGGSEALLLERSGQLDTVLTAGELLDGQVLIDIEMLLGGFENDPDGVAFVVEFADGSRAIYTASVAEPTTPALLVVLLLGFLATRS